MDFKERQREKVRQELVRRLEIERREMINQAIEQFSTKLEKSKEVKDPLFWSNQMKTTTMHKQHGSYPQVMKDDTEDSKYLIRRPPIRAFGETEGTSGIRYTFGYLGTSNLNIADLLKKPYFKRMMKIWKKQGINNKFTRFVNRQKFARRLLDVG